MIRVTGDDGFCTKPLLPKRSDAQFIVIRNFPIGVENNFKHCKTVTGAKKSNNRLFTKH